MEDFKAVKGRELFPPYFYRPQTKLQKVMFLHLSVSHSVHKLGGLHPRDMGVGQTPPAIGYCEIRSTSGRYASYWNTFLSTLDLNVASLASLTVNL